MHELISLIDEKFPISDTYKLILRELYGQNYRKLILSKFILTDSCFKYQYL